MDRRSFLSSMVAVPFVGAVTRHEMDEARDAKEYLLNRFSVAGLQCYRGPALIGLLKAGDLLTMTAEPLNNHDEFAVRLEWGGDKLGYVPRSDNRHISRLIRQGARLECRAVKICPEAGPWNALRVEVFLYV
ncbi:MAG: HIRAN domain-containing protein [Proteobacteria bacterium]|nr:HIRAN domain-containing protein [Pseudomonadota bacterium]